MEAKEKLENESLEQGVRNRNPWFTARAKQAAIAALAVAAFLIGFVPMWISARSAESECGKVRESLRLSVLQGVLATAVINARQGKFEIARRQTSDFFAGLRTEIDRNNSAVEGSRTSVVGPIMAERDGTITMLARSDASAADRLAEIYFSFLKMKDSEQKGAGAISLNEHDGK